MNIQTKRIYDVPLESDGQRILVDRLWPRGIKKVDAKLDLWLKEITPSNDLRKWYHQDIENRWAEFQQKYKERSFPDICLLFLPQWRVLNASFQVQHLQKSIKD